MEKFGFVRGMTAQRIWIHEHKPSIMEATRNVVPGGPSDSKWIGEFSRQSTALWNQACKDPEILEEYNTKAEQFRDGQASLSVKARFVTATTAGSNPLT